ncbi:MAG: hypothetical protein M1829_001010 [Trizodia sp. TS-e1964]|nr:MAG: hypothetical protein M1829_001010 [Trizodia sp. TS-e1964]
MSLNLGAFDGAFRRDQSTQVPVLSRKDIASRFSENNLIITKPEGNNGMSGMLIDLDLAIEIGKRTGATQRTGTMHFMAIEVLLGYEHTYRHDLESFFYLLLWICARRAWERGVGCEPRLRPRSSVLKNWYLGTLVEIAHTKRYHMHADGLESVLAEFPYSYECVKPLCKQLRKILFPQDKEEKLITGTPTNAEDLYSRVLQAFEAALERLSR